MDLSFTKVKDVNSPVRGDPSDAGIDFLVPNDFVEITLKPGEDVLISSGIKVIVPRGYAFVFKEKSGVATNKKLTVGAAVVDSDYRGVIYFHLFNNGVEDQTISAGEKIIQGLVIPVSLCNPIEIDEQDYSMNIMQDILYKIQKV